MKIKLLGLILFLGLAGCLGIQDVRYHFNEPKQVIKEPFEEWWEAVVGLQSKRSGDNLFCSGVVIGTNAEKDESYIVTAKHCTSSMFNGILNAIEDNGTEYPVKRIYNHGRKDIAFMIVKGVMPHKTKVYRGYADSKEFVVIGYPGGLLKNKMAQRNWADYGQSGGGVFSDGYGLHTIVSTHIAGVNVWEALQELRLEWMAND